MKLVLLNDIHVAGARNDSEIIAEHQSVFFNQVLFPYMKKHKLKDIVILGDVFERRKFVNFNSLSKARDNFFTPANEMGLLLHIFPGNHDCFHKNTNLINSPELLLSSYKNIRLFPPTKPCEILFDKLWVGIVPWISDAPEDQSEALSFISKTQCRVLFGHFDIIGFEMTPGSLCKVGLTDNIFSRFDLVLSGHYHNKSVKKNINYLGTQYDMDWSDYGISKYFHVLDTNTLKLTPVENPNHLFFKYEYRNGVTYKSEEITGKYVKLVVHERENLYDYQKAVDKIKNLHPENFVEIDLTSGESEEVETIVETSDVPIIIAKHVDTLDIPETYKPKLIGFLNELYLEASSTI